MSAPKLTAQIQGQASVSADNLNTYVQWSPTAAILRTFVGLPSMTVYLQGISAPDDGGQGTFVWFATVTQPDDNFDYIIPLGAGGGGWVRLFQDVPGTVTSLTGTANEITVSQPQGDVTLSLPSTLVAPGSLEVTGSTKLDSALTYGGVTFSNAVTGMGPLVGATSPTFTTPNLGTPSAIDLTNATNLPAASVTGTLGVAHGGTGVTASTGSVAVVLSTSPTLVTPTLGVATATSVASTNTSGFSLASGAASSTVPTLIPNRSAATTGWGSSVAGSISGIVSGTERLRLNANGLVNTAIGNVTPSTGIFTTLFAGSSIGTNGLITPASAVGIAGTALGDEPAAGSVGEYVMAEADNSLSSGSATDIISVSLSAGDWDVWGTITALGTGGTLTLLSAWISSTSASDPGQPNGGAYVYFVPGSGFTGNQTFPVGSKRMNLSTGTQIFLSAGFVYSGMAYSAHAGIYARRRR